MSHLSNVWYRATDLKIVSGSGARVTTVDGEEYLDFTAGIAVSSTGHSHPKVVAAIAEQAARIMHAQVNVYQHDLLEPLSAKLAEITPPGIDTFFFASSGDEVVEAAIKLAKRATGRTNTIVFDGSFHGYTHLGMALSTARTVYRAGYAPLPAGVFVAPFPDPHRSDQEATIAHALHGFDQLLARQTAPSETACVIMEPVLGEGGYTPAPQPFVEGILERCREHGILFIADEIQAGFGRTGRWFGLDRFGIEPDLMCMAKGIASGFPFAALGTRRELDDLWPVGSHGGSYGGNPMGCAAALATIEVMSEPGFFDNVKARGTQLVDKLSELREFHPDLRQVRGAGLMVATSFTTPEPVPPVLEHCLREGRLILMSAGTSQRVIRWMPPLTVTSDEVNEAIHAFDRALRAAG